MLGASSAASPEELLQLFQAVRARSTRLAASLSAEDQQIQAHDYASPTKWHLAHTTWFFETFVLDGLEPGRLPFDASFARLFNSYYEGAGERFARGRRGLLSRPSAARVARYRSAIEAEILELLDKARAHPERFGPCLATVELGLHHEAQHQELLLTDILANFAVHPDRPAWREGGEIRSLEPLISGWRQFSGGLFECGYSGSEFHFDNESPRHPEYIPGFELRTTTVTNAEVMDFIADAGYTTPSLWLSDGIDWVRAEGIVAPGYWRRAPDGRWLTFSLYGEIEVDPNAPATHLSGYEAEAIATWMGARLPSEFEWEHAVEQLQPDPRCGRWLEQGAVAPTNPAPGADGMVALWGETWEWTRSAYRPYPGFRPHSGTIGEYNGKFMANQWVLRGGSCATPPGHARRTYRNFFYPQQRWQFTGLRLARDLDHP